MRYDEAGINSQDAAIGLWNAQFNELSSAIRSYGSLSQSLQKLCDPSPEPGKDPRETINASMELALRHFDEKLAEMTALEDSLQRARVAFQGLRNRSVALVPSNRLPNEVLSYIFTIGVEAETEDRLRKKEGTEDPDDEGESTERKKGDANGAQRPRFLDSVLQVSRHWRNVAIETGGLWTDVNLSNNFPFESAQMKLARSKNSPIDVVLDLTQTEEEFEDEESLLRKSFELTRLESHRWGSLIVTTRWHDNMGLVLSALVANDRRPPLKTLCLAEESGDGGVLSADLLADGVMEILASVEELSLSGVRFGWEDPIYTNLVAFRLQGIGQSNHPTEEQLLQILRSCPNLATVELSDIGIVASTPEPAQAQADPPQPKPLVVLSRLLVVKLSCIRLSRIASLLSQISLPNLSFLSIRGSEDDEDDDMEEATQSLSNALCKLFSRQPDSPNNATPPLVRLHLHEIAFLGSSITALLKLLPNLVFLRLETHALDNSLLTLLETELPLLSSLYITDGDDMTSDTLLNMAEARSNSGFRLGRLSVSDCAAVDSDFLEKLQAVVGELIWNA